MENGLFVVLLEGIGLDDKVDVAERASERISGIVCGALTHEGGIASFRNCQKA